MSQLHDHGTNAPRGGFFLAVNLVIGLNKGPIKIRVEKWISCKIQALNLCETSPCLLNESITQRRSFSQHVTSNFKLTTPGLQKLFLLSIPSFRNVEWKVFISGIGLHSLVSCIIGIVSSQCFSHPICCSQFPCEVVACYQMFTNNTASPWATKSILSAAR